MAHWRPIRAWHVRCAPIDRARSVRRNVRSLLRGEVPVAALAIERVRTVPSVSRVPAWRGRGEHPTAKPGAPHDLAHRTAHMGRTWQPAAPLKHKGASRVPQPPCTPAGGGAAAWQHGSMAAWRGTPTLSMSSSRARFRFRFDMTRVPGDSIRCSYAACRFTRSLAWLPPGDSRTTPAEPDARRSREALLLLLGESKVAPLRAIGAALHRGPVRPPSASKWARVGATDQPGRRRAVRLHNHPLEIRYCDSAEERVTGQKQPHPPPSSFETEEKRPRPL
ncbi:hypothetical protein CALCODRAFT_22425 [Calocera cornea HHB12733]|uniref:Uncharacterized protein n=1 Tax=Calocera cornea HHB12733 TaxID=1353952 RepID=A0A165E568_9BASI|nr:hypothetical protein CALCODRAFT_22425 [Calocera cornea HHB12733]